eukprot:86665_1
MAQLFDDSEGATFITRRRHRPVPHLHDENPNLDRDRDDRLNNVNYRKPRTYMHVIAYGILLVAIVATYIIDRNRIIALSAESMTLRETIEQTTNHTRTLQGQVYKLTQDIQYMKQKHDDKKKEIEELESKYNAFEKEIESRALKNDGVSQTISDDIQFSYGWSGVHAGVTAKWTMNNNHLVSLSGLAVIVGSVTNADGPIATLPLNVRPMYHVYTTALDCAGKYTRIYVSPDGSISVHGGFTDSNPNQITNWISLEGISFYTN